MAILPVITAPDPRLKLKSAPVSRVDDEVRRLMDDMLATMYAAPGIGLAAAQVGVTRRIIVLDLAKEDETPRPLKIANPEIVWVSEERVTYEEGCLSLPEQYAEVERPAAAVVRCLDYDNKIREIRAEGLLATCLLHEIDHLDGVLFVDRISSVRRNMIIKKLVKARRGSRESAAG